MSAALSLTAADVARTLEAMQSSMVLPMLLSDALVLKQARGDADCFTFRSIAKREFASGLNATVPGALEALKQWTRKGAIQRTPAVEAFMATLRRSRLARSASQRVRRPERCA
jgi:hypothetical protein